ncbi:bromodomain-containing protein 8 [Anguilla anguilla]|uniref:bromodomain-containing protein 8 n=1 Tax=Anguilla anguilla TaxID=7936 RepID=UPI0015B34499|nr:bromodomain-containing protein 8 [Anguilla anguilla]
MATGVGKHKVLSLGPTEPWSVREKLCLASSVMRSGDQNWVSVSRAIKPFSEPGRPPDWFSQKHCASQYSELLETTEAPKRKRGEKGEVVETVEDVIVRRLTAERIEELKRLLRDTQEKYRKLKKEAELIQAGHLDTKLEELWGEIVQKKKQEEDEAEQKRKATDAAYQVRQAVKNTPKRATSVAVRSPLGGASPGLESPVPDPPPPPPPPPVPPTPTALPTPDEPCATPTQPPPPPPGPAVFIPLAESSGPAVAEASPRPLQEDSPQKKLLSQKATPPASPLLSELLKKGSLLAASPRLVGDGDIPAGLSNGASAISAGQATTGAPTLSRLLEASPAQFPAPLGPMVAPELPNAHPPPAPVPASDSTTSLSTGEDPGISAEAVVSPSAAEAKAAELGEEDLVAVSYIGDELDLETVGDIIAIIEEKVDDCPEALDAAAVEAALSLCEDAAAGHALSGPWESADASGPAPGPLDPAPNAMDLPADSLEPSSAHADLEMKEPGEDEEGGGNGGMVEGVAGAGSAPSPPVASDDAQIEGGGVQAQNQGVADGEEGGPDEATPTPSVKCESEEWTQPGVDLPCADSEDSSASGKDSREVKEEDGGSDADEGSVSEMKESGDGEGDGDGEGEGDGPYLSELEPPASESEDGFSLPTPSLQRYATADSAPSSPASSQFSMCSEDQEAIQAQKIWKKAIMLVWRAAANHRYASVFLQPVSDDIAPGYHSIVHRPMDLSVIKKNIEAGLIRTTAEFQRDIMLMFQNAVMYNSSDHDVYHMALEMQRDVLEQIQQFLATQLIMQTSESGISAKSLRGRESSRKDSTDKDSVPMASPAFLLSLFDSLYGQEFDEGAWLAEYEDGSTGSDSDVGAGPAGSPAHSETDRESPTHAEGGRSGGGEEGMDTTEGGEESGNESPATEEEEQEEEEEEEERGRESEGGVVEGCATPVSQEDGVTRSEEGPDAHVGGESEAAGADHCASEQGSPYSEDRPPCATESPGRRSSCQDFRKLLRDMCNDIAGHKYAELFLRPVNEKFAPHYYSVVKRPVDLQTLRRSVSRGAVVSLETLNHQLMLMFQNALMFNSADSQVYQGAQAMQREVLQHVQMLIDEVQSRDQSGSSP